MNLLLLLAGLRVWSAPSSTSLLTRIFLAISLLCLEIQIITWSGIGSLRSLAVPNLALAIALLVWRPKAVHDGGTMTGSMIAGVDVPPVRVFEAVPWPAALTAGLLVLSVNLLRPVEAADPYHLDKVAHIERTGSWVYDLQADKKINVLSNVYELALADLHQLPRIGEWFLRLHGVIGLFLYLAAIASARELLKARSGWPWIALLVIPAVFHQLVLIKNDLFVAIPGFVVLAWVIGRAREADRREYLWAAWLAGFVVAVKLTNLALLVVVGGAALLRPDRRRLLRASAAGTAAGVMSGGLLFVLVENLRWYGELMPVADISNRYAGLVDRGVGIVRFAISLVDLGLITRVFWPGRGGWGGTFGLPFVWALVVLLLLARSSRDARWVLGVCAFQFLAFALAFPDADVAQRLALAPALAAVVVALTVADGQKQTMRRPLVLVLLPVIALSAAQIGRSAVLYLTQPQAAGAQVPLGYN